MENKQRIILPVAVSIPQDAEPGGLYGSVLVSTIPLPGQNTAEEGKAKGGAVLISRLGTLLFTRVKGDVKEDGFLKDFSAGGKKFFDSGPVPFELLFENNGSVHLTPYGVIEIKNLLGKKVDEMQLDPWFAMPDSVRLREIKWERELLFGRYTAQAKINRGYNDIIDEKTITFWVVPWKIILLGLAGLFLLIWFLYWIAGHFEIRRKAKN